jgi:hypothetical protein
MARPDDVPEELRAEVDRLRRRAVALPDAAGIVSLWARSLANPHRTSSDAEIGSCSAAALALREEADELLRRLAGLLGDN